MLSCFFLSVKPGYALQARADFGIDYFLVWHAIGGYWAGVDLESPDLAKYKPRRASLNPPPGAYWWHQQGGLMMHAAVGLSPIYGQ